MSAFGMIESFFFLSLGIVFILIVLLVYHFKQRIATVEQKSDTMFDIVQNLAKELTSLKSRSVASCPVIHSNELINNYGAESEEESEEEEEEESESESEEEDESDDESDEEDSIKVIELGELPPMDDIQEPTSESDAELEVDIIELNENETDKIKVMKVDSAPPQVEPPIISVPDTSSDIFKKMPVAELRTLAISKGLCSDASKLNKVELVKMLSKK